MKKRLYRSRKDKMLGGVCAGIAKYFEIDPTLIRLVFVLIFFAEGIGFLAYVVAWIIVPEEPEDKEKINVNNENDDLSLSNNHEFKKVGNNSEEKQEDYNSNNIVHKKSSSQNIWGIILIIIGGVLLVNTMIPFIFMEKLWPLVLVILGFVLLLKNNKK